MGESWVTNGTDIPGVGERAPIALVRGCCSACGGRAEAFASLSDWWHNDATDCDGRKTATFLSGHPSGDAGAHDDTRIEGQA